MATKKRVGKNMRRTRGRKQRGGGDILSSIKSFFWSSTPPTENKTDQATVAPTETDPTQPASGTESSDTPVPTTTSGGKRRKKRGTKSK